MYMHIVYSFKQPLTLLKMTQNKYLAGGSRIVVSDRWVPKLCDPVCRDDHSMLFKVK